MLTRRAYADLQWRLRNERYFGFTAALNSADIHWRLSGILEGWNAANAPPAAAKLPADDPAIDLLWAENGRGD